MISVSGFLFSTLFLVKTRLDKLLEIFLGFIFISINTTGTQDKYTTYGVTRNSEYLEYFFRNLLLGEKNELRNRNMLIQVTDELLETNRDTPNRTSTEQVSEQLTEQEKNFVSTISNEQFTLKELMKKVGLKHRPTFLENYINPAIKKGLLRALYPEKPNHPRQKYLLTTKGLAVYRSLNK